MTSKNSDLPPSILFKLEGFSHVDLFDENKPAWFALEAAEPYIRGFRHSIECNVENVHILEPKFVSIGKGTTIGPNVCIEGDCIIGKDCQIRHGAYIRKGTIIGDGCVIGHCAEVNRSIVLNNAKIPHLNYVGDSIVGNNVNLGAGSICANLRHDKGLVEARYQQKRLATNRNKLGALIGDDARIACNCVLNPGKVVLLGEVVTK